MKANTSSIGEEAEDGANRMEELEQEVATLRAKLEECQRNYAEAREEVTALSLLNDEKVDALTAAIARVKVLEEALVLYRKAYTPDGHNAPHDCFATGPNTGNLIQDLVVCPGCEAEQAYRAALD